MNLTRIRQQFQEKIFIFESTEANKISYPIRFSISLFWNGNEELTELPSLEENKIPLPIFSSKK